MNPATEKTIRKVCKSFDHDRTQLVSILCAAQEKIGSISEDAIDAVAKALSIPRVEVQSVASFYSFLSQRPQGRIVIRLCNDIIDRMHGSERVADALSEALGIGFGETTPDGQISLTYTPCIGMCDQAPAALVNDVVVTRLSTDAAREMVHDLKQHMDPRLLVKEVGDGANAHELVQSMVVNHRRKRGEVIFARDMQLTDALTKALAMSPKEVIREIKASRLRGRGGAGFPTGLKWEFTRAAAGDQKYVICNADEGEPGTFKDRLILTQRCRLLFVGMAIAGYAVGSDSGIVYLRGEYAYLRRFLEHVLSEHRAQGLLGKNICGKNGFSFDIRIQMGAGAYVCGEETALISSCEGLRGDPKNRPPFPAQEGYLGKPTTVNNVETLCCAARIVEMGAAWFARLGTKDSPGTKLLSVSGDCRRPGVYEVPFGIKLSDLLKMSGASNAAAVQVGGPSGELVGPADFDRAICYEDLATGGSVMVFDASRDVLEIVHSFMEFFVDESCGYCTPCRVGNVLLKDRLQKILQGRGEPEDLDYLQDLCESVKQASRCGLGQTSPNPILSSMANFRSAYERRFKQSREALRPSFDIQAALRVSQQITGRESVRYSDGD